MGPLIKLLIAGALMAPSMPAFAGDRIAGIAFTRLNANGDGLLDAAELRQARAKRFERLDMNGDGFITVAEQVEAGKRMFRKAEALEGAMAIRFETLDTDGNGKLARDEFVNAPGAGLAARIDKDGDGQVSKAEFEAGLEAARAMR